MKHSFVIALSILSGAFGCGPSWTTHAPVVGAITVVDTMRGIVSRVGNEPQTRLMLRDAGATSCELQPEGATGLSALVGLEATVYGKRSSQSEVVSAPGGRCTFTVARFEVRAVDGVPAVDGVIRRNGDRLALETTTGLMRLGNPPAIFRSMVGARVWVSGPLDTGPNVYGVIVPVAK